MDAEDLDTDKIKSWRSILALIVFVLTNIIVLFPFHIPLYVPRRLWVATRHCLSAMRILSPRHGKHQHRDRINETDVSNEKIKRFVRFNFPMNFVTAPLIADLFLLAVGAIGRQEVHDGTVGAFNISPIDIMVFFLTLAYIAMSIDASGLIRWLAFKVLQKGGKNGPLLYLYLYIFFFLLSTYSGNDPVILSGTVFLAYITRVSTNIMNPRAWIFAQFAIANIGSAILVSSNPTNLVLAGAFNIKFIHYTANMVVPVVVTAIVMFPCLLYLIFNDESLIPRSISMHELSEEEKAKEPVNPNIPGARTNIEWQEKQLKNEEQVKLLYLQEIMNPWLNKRGAAFPVIIMAATLTTILALNAASSKDHPVFWVTLPAAFVMLCCDLALGWHQREETRNIAREGRREMERVQADLLLQRDEETNEEASEQRQRNGRVSDSKSVSSITRAVARDEDEITVVMDNPSSNTSPTIYSPEDTPPLLTLMATNQGFKDGASYLNQAETTADEKQDLSHTDPNKLRNRLPGGTGTAEVAEKQEPPPEEGKEEGTPCKAREPANLEVFIKNGHMWTQETFPTAAAVIANLPFALVPFALAMFVLVQALVTKGWVPVFAHGWDHWVNKTGTVGSIGGMAFLSVVLCNFAGTNIGTTILLSRVIQAWQEIHRSNGIPISDRTFWATVYSMALGVNFGAFSTAFSASLAGLLWRDILAKKQILVRPLEFARVNIPIITIAMIVGCAVLIGEVYLTRDETPYSLS